MLKAFAFLAGVGALAAAAHNNIVAGVGYRAPQAIVIVAIMFVVAISAVAIGSAWSDGRRWLSCLILLTLLCGEAYNLNATAERTITAREDQQAPLRAANAAQAAVQARIDSITIPQTTPRLEAALATQVRVAASVAVNASKRGCASNCRKLFETATKNAGDEVALARQELRTLRDGVLEHRERAEAELAALPAAASYAPLAERMGVAPWLWDVIVAALASLSLNGSGCLLIAFASHGVHRTALFQVKAAVPARVDAALLSQLDAWGYDSIRPHGRRCVRLPAAYRSYCRWCADRDCVPVSDGDFGSAFARLIGEAGISVRMEGNEPVIVGARLVDSSVGPLDTPVELKALPAPAD